MYQNRLSEVHILKNRRIQLKAGDRLLSLLEELSQATVAG